MIADLQAAPVVRIPYRPRPYQAAMHACTARFQVIVAHRRCGKSVFAVNHLLRAALQARRSDSQFGYVAPTYRMAKRIAWSYLRKYSAVVPGAVANASELSFVYPNGAKVMLLGADQPDTLRGVYLDGVVLDEFALMNPRLWPEVILPTLMDRNGWGILCGTPLGANALKRVYQAAAAGMPDWKAWMLRASQTGAIAAGQLAVARANMTSEQYEQEFECSFDGVIPGAYFARELSAAESTGRICDVPYDPALGVIASVDLGMRDAFAIWFLQEHFASGQVRAIDYREYFNKGLPQVKREVDALGYTITTWQAPHDIEVRELGTGRSRIEVAREHGMDFAKANAMSLQDGIEAVRVVLPRVWFDRKRCEYGIDALRQYHAKVLDPGRDGVGMVLSKEPEHDWTSHCADAMRTYATTRGRGMRSNWGMSLREQEQEQEKASRRYRGG